MAAVPWVLPPMVAEVVVGVAAAPRGAAIAPIVVAVE